MPTTKRSRVIQATIDEVWSLVSDPYNQPRWWPLVGRVENVDDRGFTQVLKTPKGKMVRADYLYDEVRSPDRITWDQELQGSPFERVFAEAHWELDLVATGDAETKVTLLVRQQLRGWSRFGGGTMFKGANKRIIGEALEGLERCLRG